MTQSNSTFSPQPVFNGTKAKEGNKALPLSFDWSLAASYTVDMTSIQQQGKLSGIQGLFIDNSANNGPVVVTTSVFNQAISIPAGSQGYFPLIVTNEMKFTVTSIGNVSSNVIFANFDLPFGVWAAVAAPVVIASPLAVSDAILEALVVSARFNTRNIEAQATDVDRSGTITAGGTAQTLMNANANRRGWILQNIDVAFPTEEIWVSTTGAAVIGGAGSFALSAYAAAGYPGGTIQGVGSNAISIIATTTGHKFTAKEW